MRAVSGNSRGGACFKLDKQTLRRKSNGTQKTISQNLLIKILLFLAEFFLLLRVFPNQIYENDRELRKVAHWFAEEMTQARISAVWEKWPQA